MWQSMFLGCNIFFKILRKSTLEYNCMQIRIFACRSACGNFCSVHATFFKILRENTWKLDACKYYKVFACRYWYVECMIMSIFVPCMQHFSNSTQKQVFALNRQRENKLSRRILKKAACREWKLHASISAFAAGAGAFPQPCPPRCLWAPYHSFAKIPLLCKRLTPIQAAPASGIDLAWARNDRVRVPARYTTECLAT